jgi:hypothetical protein
VPVRSWSTCSYPAVDGRLLQPPDDRPETTGPSAEAITDALSVLGIGVADKPEAAWEQQGRRFADLLIAFAATPNRHWWQRW